VGHLIKRKGNHLIIQALKHLPEVRLVVAGDGEESGSLKRLAKNEDVENRVKFLGEVRHETLKDYYGAADLLVLASSREGWANVLLESMACGTPVVATNIWGTPEVVSCDEAGILVERNVSSIVKGVDTLLKNYPDRNSTRRYAEKFSWDETTERQLRLFYSLIEKDKS
jgi:glycosyltransferase involved in cell wall biosynthesis